MWRCSHQMSCFATKRCKNCTLQRLTVVGSIPIVSTKTKQPIPLRKIWESVFLYIVFQRWKLTKIAI